MKACPRCLSTYIRKDGIVKQKQRYRCKECDYRFTVEHIGKSAIQKHGAILLYLTGMDYRRIGQIIKTSHVAVYNWIDKVSEIKQFKPAKPRQVDINDIDKYIKKAVENSNISGILLIEFDEQQLNILLANKEE